MTEDNKLNSNMETISPSFTLVNSSMNKGYRI